MANTGSYSMCMRGTDEAIEELRALLNSDAFPSIYGCDNFGFDEPNRFNGEFNGSFLNSVDIYDEESLFRSTVAQLGLEVEVYGQEVGSSYEEHFVIEGDSLTVDEQDGNAFDEPIANLRSSRTDVAPSCDDTWIRSLRSLNGCSPIFFERGNSIWTSWFTTNRESSMSSQPPTSSQTSHGGVPAGTS